MEGTANPPLFTLSAELLMMIADHLVGTDLKNVRLAHRRFAYLDSALRDLFHNILLHPDQDHFHPSVDGVAPFVRNVKTHAGRLALLSWADPFNLEGGPTVKPFKVEAMAFALKALPKMESFEIDEQQYPSCGAIFALGLEALARSQQQPKELIFKFTETYPADTNPLPIRQLWSNYDLQNLRVLQISRFDNSEYGEELTSLLTKSAATLQELHITKSYFMDLGSHPLPTLPSLRKLSLTAANYDYSLSTSWLPKFPSLEVLEIKDDEASDIPYEVADDSPNSLAQFRPFFDGIRDHPARIRLIFDPFCVHMYMFQDPTNIRNVVSFKVYIDHNTAEECHKTSFRATGNSKVDTKCRELINYMSRAGEWTIGEDGDEE